MVSGGVGKTSRSLEVGNALSVFFSFDFMKRREDVHIPVRGPAVIVEMEYIQTMHYFTTNASITRVGQGSWENTT